jgi:hypothetical protein
MRGLYHFINDHEKYDTRKVGAKIESVKSRYDDSYGFGCSPKMEKDKSVLPNAEYSYVFEDLFKKNLIMSIKAKTADEAVKHLDNMKKTNGTSKQKTLVPVSIKAA